MYASGQGHSVNQIRKLVGCTAQVVKDAFDIYSQQGIESILNVKSSGRPAKSYTAVSDATLEKLEQELSQPDSPYMSYNQIQQRMSELEGKEIKYGTAWKTSTERLKTKLKRPRPYNIQKDATREEAIKKNHVNRAYSRPSAGAGAQRSGPDGHSNMGGR
jgi:transposase